MRQGLIRSICLVTTLLGEAFGLCQVRQAWSLPVERYASRLQISCGEGQRTCSGSIRDADTLGRITGLSILKSSAGTVELAVGAAGKDGLSVQAKGVPDFSLRLSWDGDLNPDLLSGSGLNCFDLTRQGAYAFIMSRASLRSSCNESGVSGGCPVFSMESRVYNAGDPTGQKFSASIVTRSLLEQTDIAIPFSNFIRQGPRGKGSFSCAGAVTVTLKFRGFSEVDFTTGPVYTNGSEGLTPLPTATEQATLTPTATPTDTPTVTPTRTIEPTAIQSPTPSVLIGVESTPVGTQYVSPAPSTPVVTPADEPSAVVPEGALKPQVGATVRPAEPEEAVYGEVVAE